jgi:hypothetical protein
MRKLIIIALGWSRAGRRFLCDWRLLSEWWCIVRLGPGFDIPIELATVLADNFPGAWNANVNGCGRARKRDDRCNGQDAHLKKGAKGLKAKVALCGLIAQHKIPPP